MTRLLNGEGFRRIPESPTDLLWRVLLNKVKARNRYFSLVRPTSAEVANAPNDLGARIGVDEEFGDVVSGEPVAIAFDDLDDVGRSALDRQLTGPHERGQASFSIPKRCAVSRHFLIAQPSDDAFGQNHLNEEVFV